MKYFRDVIGSQLCNKALCSLCMSAIAGQTTGRKELSLSNPCNIFKPMTLIFQTMTYVSSNNLFLIFVKKQSQELTRVAPDRNIFSINVELTSTFLLFRGLVLHHFFTNFKSNNLSLKYQKFTPYGCRVIGFRKLGFVAEKSGPLLTFL